MRRFTSTHSATHASSRLATAAIAMPVTPSAGRPPRPKISSALSAALTTFCARITNITSRVWPCARSTAHSAKFIDSRNSVPPIQCR